MSRTPEAMRTFVNLLWANIPAPVTIYSSYSEQRLIVTIQIPQESGGAIRMYRSYKKGDVQKSTLDMWKLAENCSQEINNCITQL